MDYVTEGPWAQRCKGPYPFHKSKTYISWRSLSISAFLTLSSISLLSCYSFAVVVEIFVIVLQVLVIVCLLQICILLMNHLRQICQDLCFCSHVSVLSRIVFSPFSPNFFNYPSIQILEGCSSQTVDNDPQPWTTVVMSFFVQGDSLD